MQAKGQRKLIKLILAMGLICITIVVLAAYAAELRVDNNKLIHSNEQLQSEIDTLSIEIKAANNIEHIESVATNQLGMVHADESRCIYLSETEEPMGNLAAIIKESAYN